MSKEMDINKELEQKLNEYAEERLMVLNGC
jgi:hypothetical protein